MTEVALEQIPMTAEVVKLLSEDWSRPVEVKIENGELIFRNHACEERSNDALGSD